MRYTKGEWKVIHQYKLQQPYTVYTTINGLIYDIADVYIAVPNLPEGTEANANLIAAAPDMYEACKVINDYVPYNSSPKQDEAKLQLEKAIAKVEER